MRKQAIHRVMRSVLTIPCLLLLFASQTSQAKTVGVVVAGLGGEASYTEQFSAAAKVYTEALESLDSESGHIVMLDETATRDTILDAIRRQAALIDPASSSVFVLMLVGHGTADGTTWRFNIKGPDMTTEDLVAVLNEVQASQQVLVLNTSASGAALPALSQSSRIVVTATKSGGELNAVRFPVFFADALQTPTADYDRNEILTIAEAFRFAAARTAEYYEQKKLLASEHARLRGDDAATVALALLGSLKQASDDPVVAGLLEQRLVLESEFKSLKARKPDMPIADYYVELETLLIAIARLQQSIDTETGWSETDAES